MLHTNHLHGALLALWGLLCLPRVCCDMPVGSSAPVSRPSDELVTLFLGMRANVRAVQACYGCRFEPGARRMRVCVAGALRGQGVSGEGCLFEPLAQLLMWNTHSTHVGPVWAGAGFACLIGWMRVAIPFWRVMHGRSGATLDGGCCLLHCPTFVSVASSASLSALMVIAGIDTAWVRQPICITCAKGVFPAA